MCQVQEANEMGLVPRSSRCLNPTDGEQSLAGAAQRGPGFAGGNYALDGS